MFVRRGHDVVMYEGEVRFPDFGGAEEHVQSNDSELDVFCLIR